MRLLPHKDRGIYKRIEKKHTGRKTNKKKRTWLDLKQVAVVLCSHFGKIIMEKTTILDILAIDTFSCLELHPYFQEKTHTVCYYQ